MTRPLHYEDGALLLLDQRKLPVEEEWLRCETPGGVFEPPFAESLPRG